MAELQPSNSYIYAGADPIEDEDLGTYDGEDGSGGGGFSPKSVAAVVEDDEGELETAALPEPAEELVEDPAPELVAPEPEPEPIAPHEDGIRIPKARLDQESTRRKAAENRSRELERELAQLRGAQQPGDPPAPVAMDFGDLPKQMFDKALDGNLDEASRAFNQIIEQVVSKTTAALRTETAEQVARGFQQSIQNQTVDQVIATLEDTYDVFRPDTPTFDAALVEETLALQDSFIRRGHTPAEAMEKAANYALKEFHPDLMAAPAPPPPAPAEPPAPSRSVARNVKAAAQQPPELPTGREQTQADLATVASRLDEMSEEEYDALPEATRRRLRGDFV